MKKQFHLNRVILTGVLLIAALSAVFYFSSPFFETRRILSNSSIAYDTEEGEIRLKYKLTAENGQTRMECIMEDGAGCTKKISGPLDRERYLAVMDIFNDMKTAENPGRPVTVLRKNLTETKFTDSKNISWDVRFRLLAVKYCNSTESVDSEGLLLASDADLNTRLGVTTRMGAVFYNDKDGGLNVYVLRNNQPFPLGREKFIATNFEGLGLILEKGGDLIFWEKKNLQNRKIPLSEPWTSDPLRQKVIVAGSNVYYTAPAEKGLFHIMRYDYVRRKTNRVLQDTGAYLLDATADGEYILVKEPGDLSICRTYDGASGSLIGTKTAFLPGPPFEAFGFYKGPVHIVVYDGKSIEARTLDKTGFPVIKAVGAGLKNPEPVVFSFDRKQLLVKTPQGLYYACNLETGGATPVNRRPMNMTNPSFTADGGGIIFSHFDEIRRIDLKKM